MFFQKFVLTFAFAFSLICLEHGEELNYLMINILELSPNNADGNDSNAINCSHEADSSMTVLPTALGEGDGSSQAPPYDIGNTTAEPPLGQLGTDSSPEDPSTLKPTTTEESVTTFPTETPIQPLCFPDVCSRVINITWLSLPPFIFQLETGKQPEKFDDSITGVFYSIIGRAIQFCCKYLGKRGTRLQYTHSARNRDTLHGNIFHGEASMGLPVYIEDELFDHTYGGKLAFIKVLESPGLVLIANKENAIDNDLRVLWKAIFNEWPIVLISLLLCAISGICVWALVSHIFFFALNPLLSKV